ncbi:MAG: hypothetical protein ACYCU0_08020 [Solirubrobacteraceae bacterium]
MVVVVRVVEAREPVWLLVELVLEELPEEGGAPTCVVVVVMVEEVPLLVAELEDSEEELELLEDSGALELLELEVDVEVELDVGVPEVDELDVEELDVDELELVDDDCDPKPSVEGLAPSALLASAIADGVASPATVAPPPAMTDSASRRKRRAALIERPHASGARSLGVRAEA